MKNKKLFENNIGNNNRIDFVTFSRFSYYCYLALEKEVIPNEISE